MSSEMSEEYKRVLLDETKLGANVKAKTDDKKVSKKKHKKKLPKSAEAGVPLDPERWLPKWKRAKYRKRFGRKFRETQGDSAASTQVGACKKLDYYRSCGTKYGYSRSIQSKRKEEIIALITSLQRYVSS